MKLRNKKTGEVVQNFDGFTTFTNDWSSAKNLQYTSLTKLNEDWEDCAPAEPLIKDKEVRKTIRAWADYNGVEEAFYFTYGDGRSKLDASTAIISFYNELRDLKEWKKYTIAELCGEEGQ